MTDLEQHQQSLDVIVKMFERDPRLLALAQVDEPTRDACLRENIDLSKHPKVNLL